uniref:Ig-like domain-containing protein n=1 Tax=Denticeps clupeoides TaxID=299321 RepID=A0AAY4C542_9TELE
KKVPFLLYLLVQMLKISCSSTCWLVIKPGETVSITCTVTGASITDSSSYYGTGWIRQPAGKALEWINHIYYDGSTNHKDSLKNKFSVSRDTSSNTGTLTGNRLQTEDSAVYYCARYPQSHKAAETRTKNTTQIMFTIHIRFLENTLTIYIQMGTRNHAPKCFISQMTF